MVWWPQGNIPATAEMNSGKGDNIQPPNINYARPSSNHPGGAVVTYCDGHVEFVNVDDINYAIWQRKMCPNDAAANANGWLLPLP